MSEFLVFSVLKPMAQILGLIVLTLGAISFVIAYNLYCVFAAFLIEKFNKND